MTELIIAEKPSAALKIAQSFGKPAKKTLNSVSYYEVQGGTVLVAAAVGHLYGLKKTKRFYPTFELEWAPTYEISKSSAFSKKYLKTLKSLGKKAKQFTVATDYDVEGEVIGLNIIKELYKKKDANRMKFSTLTTQELQKSYQNKSKTLNWPQARAGVVRHKMDWYYGINLSYAIGSAVSKALNRYQPMSIGRVQGPALAILAERELEIQKFKPKPFWQIFANLWLKSQKIQAIHEKDKFWKKGEAERIFAKVKDKPGTVSEVKKTKQRVSPPFPFDLTSLQIEAFRVFKYPPSMTLRLAQNLYSKAYISYPRTSSQKLPRSLGLGVIIRKLSRQSKYSKLVAKVLYTKLIPNEGKKSDPAHPAIYPTGEIPKSLGAQEGRLYDLIVRRFFAVFGSPGERESTRVKMKVEGENFLFGGIITTKVGWQELYHPYSKRKEVELPNLKVGHLLKQNTELAEKETQPPARYTHASIIKKLEKEGLGTKATRSSILEILEKRKYTSGSPIEVTSFGLKVYEVLRKSAPEILSVTLTRHFDQEMTGILQNKLKPEKVLKEAQVKVTSLYAQLKEKSDDIGGSLSEAFVQTRRKQQELMPCPKCGKGSLVVRVSKASKKRFIACNAYPKCRTTWPLPQRGTISATKRRCKECESVLLQARTGRRPWQFCPNPDCKSKEKNERAT